MGNINVTKAGVLFVNLVTGFTTDSAILSNFQLNDKQGFELYQVAQELDALLDVWSNHKYALLSGRPVLRSPSIGSQKWWIGILDELQELIGECEDSLLYSKYHKLDAVIAFVSRSESAVSGKDFKHLLRDCLPEVAELLGGEVSEEFVDLTE